MDIFILIAVFIIVMWLAAMGYYFYTVRQQDALVENIDEIRKKLDEEEDEALLYEEN
jgi:flagellar basal body-associated protein FliL